MSSIPHRKKKKPVAFKQLFRHYDDISMDCWLRTLEPHAFLVSCGYTSQEIDAMVKEVPKLLDKNVHDHLAPHVRFLVKALGGGVGDLMWLDDDPNEVQDDNEDDTLERHQLRVLNEAKKVVPATFFNLRLEKALAPWHAYLTWQEGLPSGRALLLLDHDGTKLRQFLEVCAAAKVDPFVDLCNAWDTSGKQHTAEEILDFQRAFQDGLVPAVRNHLHSNTECEPGHMVELLLQHGANHLEDDHHGASLLHWAAGTGNMRAVQALLQAGMEDGLAVQDVIALDHVAKDGATPLHWAASGVTWQGVFGSGGHADVCRLLLDLAGEDLSNETTNNHNTPLEWAAWAGSLEVVQMLVAEYGADPHFCSENGNAAHWACAGGSLAVCQYLAQVCGVNFGIPNEAKGWTPLEIAVEEGHLDVAEWFGERSSSYTKQDKKRQRSGSLLP